ncbi:glutamine synthetase family protein [Oharaeibacter diazotrophicus]|uniref:Glutamine synthetase n=1 Tax=Oharaeibacter diazotrophicus TaxID=1920512 RepID=A0A4R6RNB1_9HYPH|nr:glutamine synthetase family protein [Oharaeibacter diazotrophicus]TDP87665.1 glutamine synthetase [Oharaeibacter diazotrophicus]BBE74751.1 gamma-glutamylputrescine synthetase PuuA [Pleomorphomonas sp. SM30]GLS77134.1 glutamine synthetase [Oharaeibacter diazotrophicus]
MTGLADAAPRFTSADDAIHWLRERRIDEVECIVPDMNGIMRGKIVPREDFIRIVDAGVRLPEFVFFQAVTGDSADDSEIVNPLDRDVRCVPDLTTLRVVPWYEEPTAQVICDCYFADGRMVDFAPRSVLRRVVELYAEKGLRPVVAPELEFYLTANNLDPDLPIEVPIGLSGRKESGRQAYGIEHANDFDHVVNLMYDYCEASRIEIATMAHEAGPAQLEMNFRHGDPIERADQTFLFKRTARLAARKYDMVATFMAMPHQDMPGSATHIHQSIVRIDDGGNIFAAPDGSDAPALLHYIGGLQRFVPPAMSLFCPNVNSYRRIRLESDAPINVHWGRDNRTCGLRVPDSGPEARRVENRVIGADSNPYVAMAATLAAGLIGLEEKIEPEPVVEVNAHTLGVSLPSHLSDALEELAACEPMKRVLGPRFVEAYIDVKRLEWRLYNRVISSWEREYLLLNV